LKLPVACLLFNVEKDNNRQVETHARLTELDVKQNRNRKKMPVQSEEEKEKAVFLLKTINQLVWGGLFRMKILPGKGRRGTVSFKRQAHY